MRMLKKYNVKGVRVFVRVEIVGGQVLILWEVQIGVPRDSYFQSLKGSAAILMHATKLITENMRLRAHIIRIDW
jgi:hypothetical protein